MPAQRVSALAREATATPHQRSDLYSLSLPGFWRMARSTGGMASTNGIGALEAAFVRALQRLLPEVGEKIWFGWQVARAKP